MLTNDYPLPFDLPDEPVTCPSGRTFGAGTREALVWHLLDQTARRRHRWKIAQTALHGAAGRVPAPVIAQPYAGGQRGTRCVRELRRQGFKIPHHQGGLEVYPGVETKLTFYWLDLQTMTGEVQSDLFGAAGAVPEARVPAPVASGPLMGTEIRFTDGGTPLESFDAFKPREPVIGEDAYRRFLRDAFRQGRFAPLNGRAHQVAVTPRTLACIGLDPRPVLIESLPRLGVSISLDGGP